MTETKPLRPRGRGRLFPEYIIPPEELVRRKAEKDDRGKKARSYFEQICP
ncbi:hypothetical protein [Nostoc sp.]